MVAQVFEMALYNPKEKSEPMVPINFRVPQSVSDLIDGVVRLHRIYAASRGDEYAHINASFIVRRLLRSGAEAAFAEFGGMPADEAGWAKLEEAIRVAVSGPKSSSKRR
jgi:hypothetical protein